MDAASKGDRIQSRGYPGTVQTVHGDFAHVRFDQGSSGDIALADLQPLAAEGKSWPPPLETKVPAVETK